MYSLFLLKGWFSLLYRDNFKLVIINLSIIFSWFQEAKNFGAQILYQKEANLYFKKKYFQRRIQTIVEFTVKRINFYLQILKDILY